MPIVVGPNYPIEAMAQIGRQSARAMGQEAARQQIFQEQAQLAQLDQGQQQINQRDRLAQQSIAANQDLQELQGQQASERIQLEYDRRAQEMAQRRDMEVGSAARQATNASVAQFLQTATPEGSAAIRAELNRLNQIERGVGTEYTYEQAQPLIGEVMNRVQEVMANPAFTQPPMTAEQRFAQSSVTLPDGTIIAYDDENKPHLMLRYDQSQQRYDLEAASDLRKLAIEQATIETQNPETGSVTRTFDANLYRQIIGASGIAPGESGGMPSSPAIDEVEQAVRALGFDPTVPPTPQQREAVQQYLRRAADPRVAPQEQMPTDGVGPGVTGSIEQGATDNKSLVVSAIETGVAVEDAVKAAADQLGIPGKVGIELSASVARQARELARTLDVPISMAAEIAFRSVIRAFQASPLRGMP